MFDSPTVQKIIELLDTANGIPVPKKFADCVEQDKCYEE